MGLFPFFGKKKDADAGDQSGDLSEKWFLLHVTPLGWRSCLRNVDGSQAKEPRFWSAIHVDGVGWKRLEKIIKEAVSAHAATIRKAKKITLLIDGIGVLMTDSKPQILTAASSVTARQYGQQLLNAKDVTFGFAEFPPMPGVEKKQKDGVYAFADAQAIRDYLALFDKDGIKITYAVPKEYLLVHRAIHASERVYGALHMGAHNTCLVLVNHELGVVLVRVFPVGLLTLVEAIAEKMLVRKEDAFEVMTSKDLVAEVIPATDGGESKPDALQISTHHQALRPLLTQLLDDIKESLAFFAFQKVAGMPSQLESFGVVEQVAGLSDWLSSYAGIPLVTADKNLLELLAELPQPPPCNLLKGSETNLLTIARTRYYYSEDKGFIQAKELAIESDGPSHASASPRNRGDRSRHRHKKSGGGGGGRGRQGRGHGRDHKESATSGLGALFSRLGFGNREKGPSAAEELAEESQVKDLEFMLGFVVVILAVLYWGYSEYETVAKRYNATAQNYENARNEAESLTQKLKRQAEENMTKEQAMARRRALAQRLNKDLTKVFWTEKFLALAKNMNEHIWLTDVSLAEAQRIVGGVEVKSKAMVIEGRVLPSSDGHVQIIAEYIDRLLQDYQWFMSDFRQVIFTGSQMEGSFEDPESDPQIRFTLKALYDKNVRLESKKGSKSGDNAPVGIRGMQNNIDLRNQELENVLKGGGE